MTDVARAGAAAPSDRIRAEPTPAEPSESAESEAELERSRPAPAWLIRLALLGILVLASLLVGWNIGREGLSNDYYAAAVRSMLQDPVAFLFAGFDAGRYITIDKPPLGYQLQAISAAAFGFGGPAILLPQLISSVLSVLFVYLLVRPAWGAAAGLLAALILALTPVSVAVARNTTVDATLVAVLLASALALQRGVRTGRTRWLGLAFALVGAGFALKMLQAYLVLPAFAATWMVAASGRAGRRAMELGLAMVPLVLVSFAWPTVVQLWPADVRPWIGGSPANSLFDLAFGYNGMERLATGPAYGDTGTAGPLRFLDPVLAGQVGWLLPFAALGMLLAAPILFRSGNDAQARHRAGSYLMWTGWLATCLVFFSVARFWHRHYLVVMAPAVGALAAVGMSLGWQAYRRPGAAGWLLPVAVVATGILAALTLASATELGWLAQPILGATIIGGAALGVVRATERLLGGARRSGAARRYAARLAALVAGLAIVATLIPPAAWSTWTVAGDQPLDATLPTGGPPIAGVRPGPLDGGGGDGRFFDPRPDPALLGYLGAHRGGATWILAVEGGLEAAPLIVQGGLPVMAIGGFQGRDPAIALDGFRWLIRHGRLRFASAGEKASDLDPDAPPAIPTAADVVLDWVVASCARVPEFQTLYDCAGRG